MADSEPSLFEKCAVASGLVTQKQLDDACAALRWTSDGSPTPDNAHAVRTDRQLADKLVEQGVLHPYQAEQLLEGRTKFNLGPYCIVDSIGQGGMGQVFKATHGLMGRIVAVKVLPRSKSTPEAIAGFTREIRAMAKLDHPNLVRALDAGHDGNVYYMVTEFVPGTDLRKLVRGTQPLSMATAASVICQVARGLEHAHAAGLIHRDVKPGNILVSDDGHAKLLDLGLSGSLEGDEDDPRYGKIVGTADYLSPDHIKAPTEPKPAWDVYSLGCTLYYAVTGKVPFPGGTVRDKVRAHCELRPLDPRRLNPDLEPEFVDVIADMMAKDPAERIQSAEEVVERLAPWIDPNSPHAPPVPAGAAKSKRRRTKKHAAAHSTSQPGTEETKASFPEIPAYQPGSQDSSGQVSQQSSLPVRMTDLTAIWQPLSEPIEPRAMVRPFLLLVAAPIILAAVVMLITWIVQR